MNNNQKYIAASLVSSLTTLIHGESYEHETLASTAQRLLTSFSGTVEEAYENWKHLYKQLENSPENKDDGPIGVDEDNAWICLSQTERIQISSKNGITGFVKWVYLGLFIPLKLDSNRLPHMLFERFSFTDDAWEAFISAFDDLRADQEGPAVMLGLRNCAISAVQWDVLTQRFNRFSEDQISYHHNPINALELCHPEPFEDAEQKSFFKVLTSSRKFEKLGLATKNPMTKENTELLFETVANSNSHYETLHFDLSQSEVTSLAVGHLSTWVATQGNMLEVLTLNHMKFTGQGLNILGNALSTVKPHFLNFSFLSLTDGLIQDLLTPLRDCRATLLSLCGSDIKDPRTLLAIHQTHSDRVDLRKSGLTLEIFESFANALEGNKPPRAVASFFNFIPYEDNRSNLVTDAMPELYELEPEVHSTIYFIDQELSERFSKELLQRLLACGVNLYLVTAKTEQTHSQAPLIPESVVRMKEMMYHLFSSYKNPTQDLLDQISHLSDDIRESAFQGLLSTIFDVTHIPADGNCLFASIGRALGKTHREVRTEIADYMLANHEEFGCFISFEDTMEEDDRNKLTEEERIMGESLFEAWNTFGRVEIYLQKLRKDRVWGGECEINAMLALYHHPLRIIDRTYISKVDEQGNFVLQDMLIREAPPHEDMRPREPIWLWRENGDHYNLLHPKSEKTAKRKLDFDEYSKNPSKHQKLDDEASYYTCTTTSTSTCDTAGDNTEEISEGAEGKM